MMLTKPTPARQNLSRLLREATLAFAALSPKQQAAYREAQRLLAEAAVSAELAMGTDADEARWKKERGF